MHAIGMHSIRRTFQSQWNLVLNAVYELLSRLLEQVWSEEKSEPLSVLKTSTIPGRRTAVSHSTSSSPLGHVTSRTVELVADLGIDPYEP